MLPRRAESDALNVYVRINEYRSALQENRIFSEHQTRRRPFGVAAKAVASRSRLAGIRNNMEGAVATGGGMGGSAR